MASINLTADTAGPVLIDNKANSGRVAVTVLGNLGGGALSVSTQVGGSSITALAGITPAVNTVTEVVLGAGLPLYVELAGSTAPDVWIQANPIVGRS